MTVTPVETRSGFPAKFLAGATLVFALQVGVIFWLSDRSIVVPRKPTAAPAYRWGDSRPAELAALEDPTLFMLPHQQSFSGAAWMKIPTLEFRSKNWSQQEPLRWLALKPEKLGVPFTAFMAGSPAAPFQNIVMLEPTVTSPQLPVTAAISSPSVLRIEGELAGRRLLAHAALRSWPADELLTNNVAFLANSVVQLLVDASGNSFSAVVLGPGSGFPDAEKEALRVARTARFESLETTGPERLTVRKPKLMLGTLVFEWQTLPSTNKPVTSP